MHDGNGVAEPPGHATPEGIDKRVFSFWDGFSDFGPESVDPAERAHIPHIACLPLASHLQAAPDGG